MSLVIKKVFINFKMTVSFFIYPYFDCICISRDVMIMWLLKIIASMRNILLLSTIYFFANLRAFLCVCLDKDLAFQHCFIYDYSWHCEYLN